MVKARNRSTPTKTNGSTVIQSAYVTGSRKWAIAFTASLGAILEVIDTSIVNKLPFCR
jgi:DHA2 family multidrug resistance protein